MTLLNIGLIGAAGAGKTTCTDHLAANHGYRWHALAHPLKVTVAFNIARQFRLDLFDKPYSHWYDHVDRIIHGEMGVVRQPELRQCIDREIAERGLLRRPDPLILHNVYMENGEEVGFDHDRYAADLAVRDALLIIERRYKENLRGEEQQYGTDVIRKIAADLRPGTWETTDEEWTAILANEARRDNRLGYAIAVDDVRHHHEAATIADTLGQFGLLIQIRRSEEERDAVGMDEQRLAHSSERDWSRIPAHYAIDNDGPKWALDTALDAILADARARIEEHGDLPARTLAWPTTIFDTNGVRALAA